MIKQLYRSVVLSVVFLVLFGLAYPLVETGLSQTLFPKQANGSLTRYGSNEIGQKWTGPKFFHGRLDSYNPLASGASNLGPTSKVLAHQTSTAIEVWRSLGVSHPTEELVTGSGSGLDPDISVRSAMVQVQMVARARHLSPALLRALVKRNEVSRQFGFLGESYVNVLKLNIALSKLQHG